MTIQAQDLRNLIVGTLKLVEPTSERNSSKCVIWKAQCCDCGEFEYGAKADLEKFAGLSCCPGHPYKGKEKPLEGFRLHPDLKGTLEQAEAARDWELKHNPEQPKAERPTDTPDGQEAPKDRGTLPKPSEVLQKRLGLTGYTTSSVTLTNPVEMLGCKAEKVVFAKQIDGNDLVLLHVGLVDAEGKRSIASSKKKVPDCEWTALVARLSEMQLVWREKEMKRVAK